MVVDYGRNAFRCHARLYPDDDTIYPLTWYVARPDAKLMKGPRAIMNIDTCLGVDDWIETAVGQVPDGFYQKLPNRVDLLALGRHRCGTPADFAGEGKFNPDPPYVVLNPNGLPACCGFITAGGGGGVGSGVATVTTEDDYIGSGGGVGSGVATVTTEDDYIGSGGGVGSGVADVVTVDAYIGSGGGVGSGVADVISADVYTGSGGGVGSGVADVISADVYTGSGGGVGSGVATVTTEDDYTGSGGGVGSGVATVTTEDDYTGSGGGVGSGVADVVIIDPSPGTTCSTALVGSLGTNYSFSTAVGAGTEQWLQWVVPPNLYHFDTVGIVGPGGTPVEGTIWTGTSCGTLSLITGINPTGHTVFGTGGNPVWLRLLHTVGFATSWQAKLDTGP
jgi:hypothetical protein